MTTSIIEINQRVEQLRLKYASIIKAAEASGKTPKEQAGARNLTELAQEADILSSEAQKTSDSKLITTAFVLKCAINSALME